MCKKDFIDEFPLQRLANLRFGSADGGRDSRLTDSTFVKTRSIHTFLQNDTSIIVGPMGSGKSALFKLLKDGSAVLEPLTTKYNIVPIEEHVSFYDVQMMGEDLLKKSEESNIYYLIWKLQIASRLSEYIRNHSESDFPKTKMEEDINEFLKLIDKDYSRSITEIVSKMIKSGISINFKINETPINMSIENNGNSDENKRVFLDEIILKCSKIIKEKKIKPVLIIIDKIDYFVAGQEYETQRKFIQALLEVNDDIQSKYDKQFSLKIFLRSDLFERLNLESLGWDKVNDDVLRINWSGAEIVEFFARRILLAFEDQGIFTERQIIEELYEGKNLIKLFELKLWEKLACKISPVQFFIDMIIERKIKKADFKVMDTSMKQNISQAIITKVFPRELKHKNETCKEETINIFDFLKTHFLNGYNQASPRNVLSFLKQVNSLAIVYYDQNPHVNISLNENNEYPLYKRNFIYEAYQNIVKELIKIIAKTENKWTKYFHLFLENRGNKEVFDYNWLKNKIKFDHDDDYISFLAYLEYIGFLQLKKNHENPKKRIYTLPIIYKRKCL